MGKKRSRGKLTSKLISFNELIVSNIERKKLKYYIIQSDFPYLLSLNMNFSSQIHYHLHNC